MTQKNVHDFTVRTIDGEKVSVKGADIHPLYRYLTVESGFDGDIGWNFNKFLVAPDGRVVARYGSRTEPLDKELVAKLEEILSAKQIA